MSKGFKKYSPFAEGPQNLFPKEQRQLTAALSGRAITRKSCTFSAVQRRCFLLFGSDWSSWDWRKLLATVLKTPDKGFDLLIKILLSAFDISAKLYPLQEQESSSLQRGAHSVTCNYGIYCRVKRCLGCTCRPSAHPLFPRSESHSSRPLPKEPGPEQAHRGRASTQASWGRCRFPGAAQVWAPAPPIWSAHRLGPRSPRARRPPGSLSEKRLL